MGAGLPAAAGTGGEAEAAGSTLRGAGVASDPTAGLREGGVAAAEDTTMAGTLLESTRQETREAGDFLSPSGNFS